MKLIGLSVPTDGKAIYREIADITKSGAVQEPAQTMKVEMFDAFIAGGDGSEPVKNPISKEEVSKLANKLRNGLREFGRFNVKVEGNIAEISVSNRAVRKVAKKAVSNGDVKTPAPVKKAPK